MYGFHDGDDVKLTSGECTSFRDDFVDHNGPANSAVSAPASTEDVPIERVARSIIIDRMPVEVIGRYTRDDVAILREMLADPREADSHHTVAVLIGLTSDGGDEDAEALTSFIDRTATASEDVSGAVIALGYVAHRGNGKALEFLIQATADTSTPVGEWAVNALGLSGRPEAVTKLEELRRDADAVDTRPRRAGRSIDLLDAAIADAQIVLAKGLVGYYSR